MLEQSTKVAAWTGALGFVITLSFAIGYLALAKPATPSVPPGATANPASVAAAPPTIAPEAATPRPETPPDIAGAGMQRGRPLRPNAAPTLAPVKPVCTFDAVLYEVRVGVELVDRMDVDALSKAAATREGLEKALSALGPTRTLYRAYQAVGLDEEAYIKLGSGQPTADDDPAPPTRARGTNRNPGVVFDLILREGDAGTLKLDLGINALVRLDAPDPALAAATMPALRSAELQSSRTIVPNQAFLFVDGNVFPLDANGKAVVFVARVTVGAAQMPGGGGK